LFSPTLSVRGLGSQAAEPYLGWFLQSVYLTGQNAELWLPDQAMCAWCQRCSPPPGQDCRCGIYLGYRDRLLDLPSPDLEYLPDIAMPPDGYTIKVPLRAPENCWNAPSVVGLVWGWGLIVQDEQGWHAQYAYPLELSLVCMECLVFEKSARPAKTVFAYRRFEGWVGIARCAHHTAEQVRRPPRGEEPPILVSAHAVQEQLLSCYEVERADGTLK